MRFVNSLSEEELKELLASVVKETHEDGASHGWAKRGRMVMKGLCRAVILLWALMATLSQLLMISDLQDSHKHLLQEIETLKATQADILNGLAGGFEGIAAMKTSEVDQMMKESAVRHLRELQQRFKSSQTDHLESLADQLQELILPTLKASQADLLYQLGYRAGSSTKCPAKSSSEHEIGSLKVEQILVPKGNFLERCGACTLKRPLSLDALFRSYYYGYQTMLSCYCDRSEGMDTRSIATFTVGLDASCEEVSFEDGELLCVKTAPQTSRKAFLA